MRLKSSWKPSRFHDWKRSSASSRSHSCCVDPIPDTFPAGLDTGQVLAWQLPSFEPPPSGLTFEESLETYYGAILTHFRGDRRVLGQDVLEGVVDGVEVPRLGVGTGHVGLGLLGFAHRLGERW